MNKCPKCSSAKYGPGPNFDQFRWIGCYDCGYGFKNMINELITNKKPTVFKVSRTPKGLDNILSVQPDVISEYFCAVVNVSDSPCATFDYQLKIPSFWFPINEIAQWGHSPFYGTLRVVNQYYKGDKPVLIHCHAGANRSPSVAFAILLAKGYTPKEAEESLKYEDLTEVFARNIERKHIPANIIDFLKAVDAGCNTDSIASALRKMDSLYDEFAAKKFEEQNDYVLKNGDNSDRTRLIYDKAKKRFIIVKDKDAPTPHNIYG